MPNKRLDQNKWTTHLPLSLSLLESMTLFVAVHFMLTFMIGPKIHLNYSSIMQMITISSHSSLCTFLSLLVYKAPEEYDEPYMVIESYTSFFGGQIWKFSF